MEVSIQTVLTVEVSIQTVLTVEVSIQTTDCGGVYSACTYCAKEEVTQSSARSNGTILKTADDSTVSENEVNPLKTEDETMATDSRFYS